MSAPRPVIDRPGFHDLPLAAYVADPCVTPSANAGVLRTLIDRSPAHARCKHPRLGAQPEPYRRDGALGTVVHAVLLGKGGEYAVIDPEDYPGKSGGIPEGWTNAAIRAARDAVMASGRTPILPKDMALAEAMAEAASAQLRRHAVGAVFERPGTAETTMLWQEHGVWCRGCIDWLPDDRHAYYDIKTTKSAHPDSFQRVAFGLGYDFSAAHYRAGLEALLELEVPARFVVIETEPPYALSVVELNAMALEYARRRRRAALKMWGACLAADDWPGYPGDVVEIEMPVWATYQQETRETSGQYDPSMLKMLLDMQDTREAAE